MYAVARQSRHPCLLIGRATEQLHACLLQLHACSGAASLMQHCCRSLRKIEGLQLQRLRLDIKDFQPRGVQGLCNGMAPWVATGKHLCGAATDFTLRCCASSLQQADKPDQLSNAEPSPRAQSSAEVEPEPTMPAARELGQADSASRACTSLHPAEDHQQNCKSRQIVPDAADSIRGQADAQAHLASNASPNTQIGPGQGFQGLCVATCCHHRCCWQHYVGKLLFRQLGFSPDDFELISWMTGAQMPPMKVLSSAQCTHRLCAALPNFLPFYSQVGLYTSHGTEMGSSRCSIRSSNVARLPPICIACVA